MLMFFARAVIEMVAADGEPVAVAAEEEHVKIGSARLIPEASGTAATATGSPSAATISSRRAQNINMTYFIMDNFVYGLTKKQTSPTSPIGFKSKTDPTGAIDQPVNPMKKLISAGATFIARTHAAQVPHMIQMIERSVRSPGLLRHRMFVRMRRIFPGRFDPANPKKGGSFELIHERKMGQHTRGRAAARRHRRARCV